MEIRGLEIRGQILIIDYTYYSHVSRFDPMTRVSLIVTSGISLEDWGTAFGNNAITNDIVDRLFHRANVINIRQARSYRTEGPNAPQLDFAENTDS